MEEMAAAPVVHLAGPSQVPRDQDPAIWHSSSALCFLAIVIQHLIQLIRQQGHKFCLERIQS
jgi:hypothetical protein